MTILPRRFILKIENGVWDLSSMTKLLLDGSKFCVMRASLGVMSELIPVLLNAFTRRLESIGVFSNLLFNKQLVHHADRRSVCFQEMFHSMSTFVSMEGNISSESTWKRSFSTLRSVCRTAFPQHSAIACISAKDCCSEKQSERCFDSEPRHRQGIEGENKKSM